MFKKVLSAAALAMTVSIGATAADYGLPTDIQDGNILHCFDWSCAQVEAELDNIAAAGFGAVQLSPMQGSAQSGAEWYYCYLPYDFKLISNGVGNASSLTSLCTAAHERGIKVIVDVVANHVNGASGYKDPWWETNNRERWNGSIDYGNRYSITHNQLGGYGDANSESSEVQARAKAYVEALKACGVDGIRWDAAKHIGLPSEGCNFWPTVTSVSGMWHYGEILDSPSPSNGDAVMKEYTSYMSVTDNGYCDGVRDAINGGGAPTGYAGWAASTIADNKVVYWAESHDDYSNEWTKTTYISQAVIDRAWAVIACRNGASSLYFSRPLTTGKDNIKVGVKGSTNFKSTHIAAVNKLRNKAVGHADYFSSSNGVVSVTRKDVGAVIVKGSGSGSVSISNGGSYCPAGTYIDQVSGSTFTVTSSTISGNVGSTGIAVLVIDGEAPTPDPTPDPTPGSYPSQLYLIGSLNSWGTSTSIAADTAADGVYTWNSVNLTKAEDANASYFSFVTTQGADWDAVNGSDRYGAATDNASITSSASIVKYAVNVNASAAYSWSAAVGTYKIVADLTTMTVTISSGGSTDDPTPDPDPTPSDAVTINGDYNIAYSGSHTHVHYWGGATASTWPGVAFTTATGSDGNTYKVAKIDAASTGIVFNTNGSTQTGDLTYTGTYIMNDSGATSTKVVFSNGSTDDPTPTPDPESEHYVYFDGTSFSQPQVWAWNDTENCTASGTWGGDNMTQKDGKWYWAVPSGKSLPTGIIIHEGDNKIGGGDLVYVDKATYHQDGSYTANGTDDPVDPSDAVTIVGDYNLAYSGNLTKVHYWGGASESTWPGVTMTTATGSDGKTYKVAKVASGTTGCLFNSNGDADKTGDLVYTGSYIMNDSGKTSTKVIFTTEEEEAAPTVTISPNGGTVKGTSNVTVTIAGEATSISADFNGTALTLANGSNSIAVSSYLSDGQTGTLTVSATNAVGTTTKEATFTRSDESDPTPVPSGNNLITDYYKVNPNRQVGSNRTVNMSFSNQNATNALSNWTEADLIAQGVARDVSQAFRGNHEYPVVDSYALYAAYDNTNLYLGVQFVYEVWGYGDGGYAKKLGGESKPYNMDGRLMIAFDLDPNKSFDGYINGTGAIWNDTSAPGAKFDNGVDAVWIGSTKPGVGTPGFFIPTADGHASYDAAYCLTSTVNYGYADGLASCINEVYGQSDFGYDKSLLEGNTGFVDLRSEVEDTDHTFYEFKIPLSLLGVTEDYIKTTGIGVQYLDVYGSSPVGGTPYDPSFFDNATVAYSMDESSSHEREDEDVITYAPARIGFMTSGVEDVVIAPTEEDGEVEYFNLQGIRVENPANGIYIKRQGSQTSKVYVR